MLLAQGNANFTANLTNFLTGVQRVRKEVQDVRGLNTTIAFKTRLATGTLQTLRTTVRTSLGVISRNSYVEVGARLKTGSTAKLRNELDTALAGIQNRVIDVRANVVGAKDVRELTNAVRGFDRVAANGSNRTLVLDVRLAAGMAVKFKTVNSLIDSVRSKSPIVITIDANILNLAALTQLRTVLQDCVVRANALRSATGGIGNATNAINRVTRATNDYNDALGQTINSIRRYAIGYLGVKLLIDGFRFLKAAVIDYDVTLNQTRTSLEAMLDGNKRLVGGIIKDMEDFAARTPYALDQLSPILVQLRLAKIDADRLVPSLEALGNVAAMTGNGAEGIMRMANSFRDAAARGRITGEEVRELSRQAIPVYEYIAKSWNISTEKAQEYVRKGMIPAKQATDAIIKGAANDKQFQGMLERLSKTLSGAMQNISDVIKRVIHSATQDTTNELTKLMVRVARFVQTKDFEKWAANTFRTIGSVFAFTFGVIGKVFGFIVSHKPILIAVMTAIGGRILWVAGTALAALATSFIQATGRALVMGASIITSLQAMNPYMKLALLAVLMYANNWLHARDIVHAVIVGITGWIGDLQVGFASLLGMIAKVDVANVTGLKGMDNDFAQQVRNDVDARSAAVQESLAKFSDKIDGAKKQVADLFSSLANPFGIDKLVNSWMKSAQDAVSKVNTAKPGIPNYEGQFVASSKDKDKAAKKAEAERLKREKDVLRDNAAAWKLYADAVAESAKRQMGAYKDLQSSITDLFEGMQRRLLDLGIITNPLAKVLGDFGTMLNLGQRMQNVANYAQGVQQRAARYQGASEQGLERANGLDGQTARTGAQRLLNNDRTYQGAVNNASFDSVVKAAIIKGVNTPMGASACARFVSRAFDMIGIPKSVLKRTDWAAGLQENAAKVARRIPVSQAGAGDLLVSRSASANSGRHVGIGVGNGMFAAKNKDRHSPIAGYGWDYAYDTSALATRGMKQLQLANQKQVALGKMFKEKPNLTNVGSGALFEGTSMEGSLTGLTGVPKAWGAAVQESKRNASEFAMQGQMASKKFQDQLKNISEMTGLSLTKVIQWFRNLAKVTDQLANIQAARLQSRENARGLNREIALQGNRGDEIAALRYDFTKGERKDTPAQERQWEIYLTRKKIIGSMVQDTNALINSLNRQEKAAQATDKVMGGSAMQMALYARAVEIANIKAKNQAELQDKLNSQDKGVVHGAQQELARRNEATVQDFLNGKIREYTIALNRNKAAIDERNQSFDLQMRLLKDNAVSVTEIADRVEADNKARAKAIETYVTFKDELGAVGAALAAAKAAQDAYNESMDGAKQARQIKFASDYRTAIQETANAQLALNRELAIAARYSANDPEFARANAMSKKRQELDNQVSAGTLTQANSNLMMSQFGKDYDIERQRELIAEIAKGTGEAEKAMQMFGDTSVQATVKWRIAFGDLKNATQEQKDAALQSVTTSASAGYASEQLAEVTNKRIEKEAELNARIADKRINQSRRVSAVLRQQEEWRLRDAQAEANGIKLSVEAQAALTKARQEYLNILQRIEDKKSADKFKDMWKKVAQELQGVFESAFGSIMTDGFSSFADNLLNGIIDLMNKMAARILASEVMKLLAGALGFNYQSDTPGFATGGRVTANSLVKVGERGIEYFKPSVSGDIISQKQAEARGLIGSGSTSTGSNNNAVPVVNQYNISVDKVIANNPEEFAGKARNLSEGQRARQVAELSNRGQRSM